MDFFQRIGNFFSGKGWINDEEKRRKEQQAQPAQPQPKVTFNNQANTNARWNNTSNWINSSSPAAMKPTDTLKADIAPKIDTVPKANEFNDNQIKQETKPIIPQKTVNEAPKKPTFFDYLNPFGEHGLFGAKQQQNFKKTVEKPIADNVEKFNKWIDSSDKQEGFQWNDPGDYARFAAKIPGGAVQGLAEAPNKIANTITGIEADENGKVKQLNGWQRLGKGLDAGISVGGLGFGGSGTLIRSAIGQGGKQLAGQAAKQTIAKKALGLGGNILKDAAKEGAEEVAQTFAQDLADDGKVNTKLGDYAQSGALGALGGGMMSGIGHAVNGVKGVVRNKINPYGENGVGINRLSPNQMKYNAAEVIGGIAGDTRKRLSQAAFGDLQKARTGNPYRTSDGMDVELSKAGNRKYTSTGARAINDNFIVKQRLAPQIDEVIAKSKLIDSAEDAKNHGIAPDGFDYREIPVRYRGKDYVSTIDIAKNNTTGRNTLYEGNVRSQEKSRPGDLNGAPRGQAERGLSDFSSESIAQEVKDVDTTSPALAQKKAEVDDAKYKLSPVQEEYFKDSKIRDENDNLKTVYHGTNAEFDAFNPSNTSSNKWGEGNYLAFNRDAAKNYGKNVKEMYANITSPISNNQKTVSFEQYDTLHRRINNGEPAYREDYDMYDNDMDLLWDITDNGQWKKYAQDIKDTTGKDGVIMDDMAITFSPSQTKYINNLNPTDSPDMRYKRQADAQMQELASQSNLLARHLQLTGDENLVFNEWQNEMQKKALGYYDPKTDKINLNKLSEDTLNHELGHKLLTRVENKQDLLNSIRESYGDEYLINKYGSQYGNDLNLLAEEQLADGFSDYYNGRLNGEDKVRLGARLGIPQKVLAIYDRITEAIMGLVGKQDAIKQFYAQMETGKFRNEVFGNTEQLPAYKLDDDLSRILNHYKQSPRGGLDMNLVRQEYTNNPEAIRRIDEVIAEVKQEAAQNKSRAQQEREYYTKLNNIANSFQPWQPNQGLNVNAIQDFHRAEYELAKEYPDIANNQAIIDAYEKNSALNNNTENIYHPDNQTDIDNIEAADINPSEYAKEMTKQQKLARKGEQPTLRKRWQNFKEDMREKFVDRFAPIEDRLKNQSEQLEMRNAIDRTLRAYGISEAFIRDNNFDKLITGFKNKKELQTFDQALIAKHALELEANGIETGRDIAKDKALVKATSKRFAKEFKQVREYSDKVLQQTVGYGLISQDTANYLRKKYPDYVPFDRIFSDKELDTQMKHGVGAGEASLSKQDIVQRIKGSSRSIDSPLNALITKTQDMIQQGERNKTAELLASYAKDPKNPFQLQELKAGESANGRPTISYLDNGQKRTFLAAPEVARAAKNMNREQMGIILRALAAPARLLRMGATTVNAGFTMANVVKDFVGATVNSKGGFNSMNPKSIVSALGAAFHHNGDLYAEMQREGVLGNIYELTRNASDLNLNEIRSHKNILTRSLHNAKSPLKTLENTIGRSEDFGRALQYVANKKYAKRKGMSESEAIKFAADQARWNSTNFLRSGTYGKAINAIVPYSNANIQGQRITLRRMKENPARYTGKIALGIVAPTVAAMALSYSNDENKKIMENLPDYVKENNVVVIGPGAKYNKEQNKWEGVYLVPVPPQFSPLHRQLHNMTRSAMTGQQFDVGKTVGDAVEQVTTVNPMEIRRTGAQYVPQAVKPFVETWANKNLYTGQEVVPEGMKNLDGKDQWDNSTSLTARKVGELTGLSPKQIDNAFRTSTAGGGQNLLHGMDFAIAKATAASDDEIKGRSILDSVVGRFYAPKGTSQSSYFYQSLEKAAKDNKLSGSDLELYQALTSRKYNGDGSVEGKTEGDVLMNNRILANKPNIVKALSEAAKWRSAQTGEELDPLYKLPVDKQQYFYHLQGSPKNGAEQRKLKQDAPWLEDFQKERSAYFKRQDFKSGKSNRVPYPEVSDELQATLKTYHDMPSSPQKWAYLDAHPELSDHFKQIEDYNNKVREAQGYAPQRTRPQQSQYVKMQMANKNWRDPAVAKYLQDMNVYNITNSASLAEMQGEDLSPKALRAIQSLSRYGLVKNPDGTFALKYPDGQGTNESHIQAGAVDTNSFWGRGGRRGYRRGGGSTGSGARTSTDTLKTANATAISMNTFKRNQSSRAPQFTGKAIQLNQLLKSRKPKSRVVTFR
nr:MAG TPA: Large polyvalent protein associated domain 38 [Caudoviricetes sp.]